MNCLNEVLWWTLVCNQDLSLTKDFMALLGALGKWPSGTASAAKTT